MNALLERFLKPHFLSNAQRTLSERSEAPTVPTLFFKLAFPTNRNIYDAAETH